MGYKAESGTGISFLPQNMLKDSVTVRSAFESTTVHFAPSAKEYMFNLIVDGLREALRQVKEGGEIQEYELGKFGWFMDPDGNKVKLWELPTSGE